MLTSTSPVTINATANGVGVGLQIVPRYTSTGVTAAVNFTMQQYSQPGGTGPATKLGSPKTIQIPDVFAAAQTDAALATAIAAIEAAIQAYITAKGL